MSRFCLKNIDNAMFQLQQLGLPLGFRSKVYWWQEYLTHNFCQPYAKKKYPRGSNRCNWNKLLSNPES